MKMEEGASFLQMSRVTKVSAALKKRILNASAMATRTAQQTGDIRLRLLADELALVAMNRSPKSVFEPVCKKIHEFHGMLTKEQEEWQIFVNDCNNVKLDLNTTIDALKANITNSEGERDRLEAGLVRAEQQIEQSTNTIAETKENLGAETTARNEAHAAFLAEHGNNSAAVEALTEALRILQNEYGGEPEATQEHGNKGFDDYAKAEGGSAINLIKDLKTQTVATMSSSVTSENDAQQDYNSLVMGRNNVLAAEIAMKAIATEQKAELEEQLVEEKNRLKMYNEEKEDTEENLEKKTTDCRFRSDNLGTKQDSIKSEQAVLTTCIDILGCNPAPVAK